MPGKDIPGIKGVPGAMNQLKAWENQDLANVRIRGLGPKHREKLASAGIVRVIDLLSFLPREYLDYSEITPIHEAPLERSVLIRGAVISKANGQTHRRRIPFLEILVDDGFGAIRAIWFNQPYLDELIHKGDAITLRGKIKLDRPGRTMHAPKFEIKAEETPIGVEPVYRQIGGVRSERIAAWIFLLIEQMPDLEALPAHIIARYKFPKRGIALKIVHRPPDSETLAAIRTREAPALQRLIFEDFFRYQHKVQRLSRRQQAQPYPRLKVNVSTLDAFYRCLPFKPTKDQTEVIDALFRELASGNRIQTLVQGDVGCGKTLIGWAAACLFKAAGYQTALLCPTTVLANQHYAGARLLLEPLGVNVTLLTAQAAKKEQDANLDRVRNGSADLIVATHKILSEDVVFSRLGLAMIDEQQRFGVEQRQSLLQKGESPHYLAFSATPIPRSLAMTLYGDVDILQIKQKPAGRGSITTILKRERNRPEIIRFARARIDRGESVFWVFPLIEGDEQRQEQSAVAMHQSFCVNEFAGLSVGLIHGRMDKESAGTVMQKFRDGVHRVLVATTVIEVGVDAPAASIMVVEAANQFGLSQLHQLRGRVGRDGKQAYCFFVYPDQISESSLNRLGLLKKYQDGFKIAEYDLNLRGAGDLLGKRQSGWAGFLFADPWRDRLWMKPARAAVLDQEGYFEKQKSQVMTSGREG